VSNTKTKTKIYSFTYTFNDGEERGNYEFRLAASSKAEALQKFEALKGAVLKCETPCVEWDNYRCDQLSQLEDLIRECQSINTGSGVLARLDRIIEIAKQLDDWDDERKKASFMSFVKDYAIGCRFGEVQP
jgi:hypothetical protein